MKLIIHDSQQVIDIDFAKWLTYKVSVKLISEIKNYNFVNWDNYLTTSASINRLYKKDYKATDAIIFAAKNLVFTYVPGEIVITFCTTKFVPGFDRLRLDTFVKLINYGTLDLKGCPIFSDTLSHFEDHITEYVQTYYRV